jgi:hypothetical protein
VAAVVADTSPLIALHQVSQLLLLAQLFGTVEIPPAVAREAAPSLPVLPSWIHIRALSQPIGSEILSAALGPGESEALALALELEADALILDERHARRLALALGLPVLGTAAVLLRAKQAGFISAVQPLLDDLLRSGFRLSPASARRFSETRASGLSELPSRLLPSAPQDGIFRACKGRIANKDGVV